MMLRRANTHQPSVNLLVRAIREVTIGPSKLHKRRALTLTVLPRALACLPRMFSTHLVVLWRKKVKPPKCIKKLTETLAQASKELVITTGKLTLALLMPPVTSRLILSVTVNRSCLTELQSPSCPRESRKLSPRLSSLRRLLRIKKPLHKTCSAQ